MKRSPYGLIWRWGFSLVGVVLGGWATMGLWRGVVAAGVVLAAGGVGARVQAQRLPVGVTPEHYALTITPDLAKARFAGSEAIEVVLDKATTTITLNAAEIEFVSVKAMVGDFTPMFQTATVTLDERKEQATFTFATSLPAGRVTLQIEYTGIMNNKLRGFYLSKTKVRRYGVTQFEATDARRAFPSFDEPALKATFDVTLVVDAGDTAISNTKVVSDTPGPVAGSIRLRLRRRRRCRPTWWRGWWATSSVREGKSDGVAIRACATPDKVGADTVRAGCGEADTARLRPVLRHQVPDGETGSGGDSRLRGGRDGELRVHHLSRDGDAGGREERGAAGEEGGCGDGGARDVAPVVWGPGDAGVVGQSVAERGFCDLDGDQSFGKVAARSGSLRRTCAGQEPHMDEDAGRTRGRSGHRRRRRRRSTRCSTTSRMARPVR